MNELTASIESICEKSHTLVPGELLWHSLCCFENASLNADAIYEVLKHLCGQARTKLEDDLRAILANQPNALNDGYSAFHTVSGGRGKLANAWGRERVIPPEFLKLVARLAEKQEFSGLVGDHRIIKGKTVVYKTSEKESV